MATYSPLALKAIAMAGGFLPGAQVTDAVAVALATSGGDPNYSSGGRIGLWGITAGTAGFTAKQLASPPVNALAAHQIFAQDGNQFTPAHWPAWSSGSAQKEVTTLDNSSTWSSAGTSGPGFWDGVGGALAGSGDPLNPLNVATGGVAGIVQGAAGSVPGLTGVDAIAGDFDKAAKWMTTPGSWLHIAYVIGGAALVLAGLVVIARPAINGAAGAVTKVATGATPVGRATKAVGAVQKRRAAAAASAQQRTRRQAQGEQRRGRVQQRIEERHSWARAREQRAAAKHATKKTTTKSKSEPKESGSGD